LATSRRGNRRTAYPLSSPFDGVNRRLLEQVVANPRTSLADLARKVGMSRPSVAERLQRLEEAGVVLGYRVELDPAALGLPITAYVRVRPGLRQHSNVAELARKTKEVVECHRITGEDCFLMKVHVASVQHLETVLDRFLAYGQTVSSIVQSSPVPQRQPPLPAET
jgi:Lrp/AsnC family transcriptional regulator, leucine-responsive regulatory protein